MANKYRNIIKAVFGTEWAILPDKMEQICELLEWRSQGVTLTRDQIASRVGLMDFPTDSAAGSVAVMQLFGTISQRMNALSEFSGGTSTEQFARAFIENRDNPDVSAIVINADTPGGAVPGVPELAELIFNARGSKPIITVVNPMLASAGYWIGSAADEIVAIPSASDIGSIGVVTMHTDKTEANAKAGVKHTIIRSTDFKYEGSTVEPLSEATREFYQARVMSIHRDFVGSVARYRGVSADRVESGFGRGRTYRANEAKDAGMIDRIATLEDVLAELGSKASSFSIATTADVVTQVSKGTDTMNPKLKSALVKAGLCKVTDDDATFTAALALHTTAAEVADGSDDATILASFGATPAEVVTTATPAATGPAPAPACMSQVDLLSTIRVSAVPADRQMELLAQITPQLSTLSLSQVLDKINAEARRDVETAGIAKPAVTGDSTDKFTAAARDAILMRQLGNKRPEKIYDFKTGEYAEWKPGRQQYGLQNLPKLAERCLVQCGIPYERVANLAPMQVAQLVMGGNAANMGLGGVFASSDGPSFNVTGMFSNILLDAANVLLRMSYTEANTTYQDWMKQAPSIADFKTVNRVIAGELSDPRAVPEDGEFEETTLSDGNESYKLTVWGSIFSHSWQTVVNDQLSSFTEIPAKQGRSMRRKQNKLAYGVVNDNAALSDTVALFSAATHTNRQTGANATATALKAKWATMVADMAEQTGLDSDSTALNLSPRYCVAPPAIMDLVLTALNSSSVDATNPGINNTMQGRFEPIFDAELGAAQGGSDTRYVLAADSNDVDTIEYAFLQGLESPVIEQETSFSSLAIKQRIYQAFAVKAIDFRGLQDDTGA